MKTKRLEDFWKSERKSQKSSSSSPFVQNEVEQNDQGQGAHSNEEVPPLFPSQAQNEEVQDEEIDQNEHEPHFLPLKYQNGVYLLPHDPGKRIPISSYPVNDRDVVRRQYIDKKPCRPIPNKGEFRQTLIGSKMRRFSLKWYDKYDWIEYSDHNDAAFCYYCYLFKDSTKYPGGDVFVNGGWRSWGKPERLIKHVGGSSSAHNEAREKYELFTSQKLNIVEKIEKVSVESENLYKSRLIYSLRCLRFLLKQGLAFRGHDESKSSSNKGNFRELLKWLAGNNENVAKVVLTKAPKNHQATSPKIQRDLISSCAEETTKRIIQELNNDLFGILAD